MRFAFFRIIAILLLALFAGPARADISHLTEQEFRNLATELAPKVNLFRDAWEKDPDAVFYGGTSRDYLYWLKGKFLEAQNREQALKLSEELRKLPLIDVREFIIGESDVDIISNKGVKVDPAQYGVRKIDSIRNDIFDPATELGKNELWQGHVPVEKIQIRQKGIQQAEALGDGLHEIYTGKLTVQYPDPDKFAQTKFAREGINHPVLLALRYLRLQGINYFKTHGAGYPRKDLLLSGFEEKSLGETRKVIDGVLDGKALEKLLNNNKFQSWLNGTIQKSFRSYTNPTAALEILKEFKVDQLPVAYGEKMVEPLNQYVFIQHRDEAKIEESLRKFQVNREKFFVDPKGIFSDGYFYHGTRTEPAFRSILFQGILPSGSGSGGKGLYGVNGKNQQFSEEWANDKKRLLKFPVKPGAKIVDVTKGEGARVFKAFGRDEDAFAHAFGVDIVRYPYMTEAFVVKNSGALGPAEGVYRQLKPLGELLRTIGKLKTAEEVVDTLVINQVSSQEAELLLKEVSFPEEEIWQAIHKQLTGEDAVAARIFGGTELWKKNFHRAVPELLAVKDISLFGEALRAYSSGKPPMDNDFAERFIKVAQSWPDKNEEFRLLAIEAVARNPQFPKLAEVLNALYFAERSNPIVHDALTMIAEARISQSQRAALRPELQPGEYQTRGGLHPYEKALARIFMGDTPADIVPVLKKFIVGQEWNSSNLAEFVMERSANQPEILEAYLGMEEEYHFNSIMTGFEENPAWLKHEDTVGKFLRRWVPRPAELFSPGWSKDTERLKEIWKHTPESDRVSFSTIFLNLLAENGAWKKDPEFVASLIANQPYFTGSVQRRVIPLMLKDPEILKHPQLIGTLAKGRFHFHFPDDAIRIFSSPEMLQYPEFVRPGLQYVVDRGRVARALLSQPQFAKYPELMEELVVDVKYDYYTPEAKAFLRELLDLPHWRKHPAFQDLKVGGKISIDKLWLRAVERFPKKYKHLIAVKAHCSSFFSSFSSKNR